MPVEPHEIDAIGVLGLALSGTASLVAGGGGRRRRCTRSVAGPPQHPSSSPLHGTPRGSTMRQSASDRWRPRARGCRRLAVHERRADHRRPRRITRGPVARVRRAQRRRDGGQAQRSAETQPVSSAARASQWTPIGKTSPNPSQRRPNTVIVRHALTSLRTDIERVHGAVGEVAHRENAGEVEKPTLSAPRGPVDGQIKGVALRRHQAPRL